MRRLLLACLFVLAALPALAATVTTKYSLSNAGWTDLGAGPLLLSFTGTGGVYAIGDTTPSLKNEGFTKARGGSVAVRTASHVWGTTKDNFGVSAYVAPITGGGGAAPTSVWSAADAAANLMTLSNGGLTFTSTNATDWRTIRGSISKSSGKLYVEYLAVNVVGPGAFGVGSAGASVALGAFLGSSPYGTGFYTGSGNAFISMGAGGATIAGAGPYGLGAGDVIGIAIDLDAGKIWEAKNNVWQTGNPSTGATPQVTYVPAQVAPFFPGITTDGVGASWTLQSTAASQTYAPPAGFTPWDGGTAPPPTSVWSSSDAAAGGMTLSNGGLTVAAPTSGGYETVRGTISQTAGKLYVEFLLATSSNGNTLFGLGNATITIANFLGSSNYGVGFDQPTQISAAGFTLFNTNIGMPANAGEVWGLAVDFTTNKLWVSKNGVWVNGGSPVAGTGQDVSFVPATVGALFPAISISPGGGTWTLKPTAASQTYAPPAGFSAWDAGGAAPGCSEATAYLARAPGETAHAADLTTLICGLVTDGVWAKLDGLYVLAQQTAADGLLNLISTSYPLATNGTFTAYQGYSGFTGTGMTLTGYNPSGGSLKFTQSNASLGVWSYAVINDSGGEMGSSLGTSGIYDDYAGAFYPRVNASATPSVTTPGTKGLFVGDRTISASLEAYWNGVDQGTIAGTSVAPDGSFFVGCGGSPSTCTSQIVSEAHIGASLGASGNLALYNRLRTYLTSVGVP